MVGRTGYRWAWLAIAAIALLVCPVDVARTAPACPKPGESYPSPYPDPRLFEQAILSQSAHRPSGRRLTGITVPHHLVAADLIARGIRLAEGQDYDRILLLSPDHFRKTRTAFATTSHDFSTPFGDVAVDDQAVEGLIEAGVETSCLFAREHGILAILPFLARQMPGVPIVPVVISTRSSREDWDQLADLLTPLAGNRTLVIQSTDFSHYFPADEARALDQQVLNILAGGSLDQLEQLRQPDHLDSLGATYVQAKLQRDLHGARPAVIASANQQAYAASRLRETTGYVVLAYGDFGGTPTHDLAGGALVYLGGDVHFARALTRALGDADAADRVVAALTGLTGGNPLVINLEGVILPNVPVGLPHMTLAMPRDLTLDLLDRMGVAAVGLANNHFGDLGDAGRAETLLALEEAGIPHFRQGEAVEVGGLTIVGLTDIDSSGPPYVDLIDRGLLAGLLVEDPARPVVAFVHWGREYVDAPGPRESLLAQEMRQRGAGIIAGAHPHVASVELDALAGGEAVMAYSLGNLLFDQSSDRSSGKLLELRVFEQGTVFARLVDLPNLFDLATDAR